MPSPESNSQQKPSAFSFLAVMPYAAGILVILLLAAVTVWAPSPFAFLEGQLFDFWFGIRGPRPPSNHIVIAGIDQPSLDEYGRWPWPRDLLAALAENICALQPKLVVFDITFARDPASESERIATDSLAKVAQRCSNVLFPYFFFQEDRKNVSNSLPPPPEVDSTALHPAFQNRFVIQAKKLVVSSSQLTRGGRCGGHVNVLLADDNACRKEVQIIHFGGSYLPSMPVVAASRALEIDRSRIQLVPDSGITMGNRFLPLDANGCSLINYYGPSGHFPAVSARKLLTHSADPLRIKDRVVLVGLTAPGQSVVDKTSFGRAMPTVEKMATVISNTLEGEWLNRRVENSLLESFLLLLAGIAAVAGLWFKRTRVVIVAAIGWTAFCLFISFMAFNSYHNWLKMGTVALSPWFALLVVMAVGIWARRKEKGGT